MFGEPGARGRPPPPPPHPPGGGGGGRISSRWAIACSVLGTAPPQRSRTRPDGWQLLRRWHEYRGAHCSWRRELRPGGGGDRPPPPHTPHPPPPPCLRPPPPRGQSGYQAPPRANPPRHSR